MLFPTIGSAGGTRLRRCVRPMGSCRTTALPAERRMADRVLAGLPQDPAAVGVVPTACDAFAP